MFDTSTVDLGKKKRKEKKSINNDLEVGFTVISPPSKSPPRSLHATKFDSAITVYNPKLGWFLLLKKSSLNYFLELK